MVLDRAGSHVSRRLRVPEGIRPVFLPPCSPELQLVERVCSAPGGSRAKPASWQGGGEPILPRSSGGRAVLGPYENPQTSGGIPSSTGDLVRGNRRERVSFLGGN